MGGRGPRGQAGSGPPSRGAWGLSSLRAQPGVMCQQELEAIKLKLWAMEQAQGLEPPRVQAQAREEAGTGTTLAGQLLSPKTGRSQRATPTPSLCNRPPESSGTWL